MVGIDTGSVFFDGSIFLFGLNTFGRKRMTLLGKTVKLSGTSQKGKNRTREHGDRWTVLAETDRVLFAPSDAGPWLFVAPVGKGQDDKASRWVRVSGDADFIVLALAD